MSPTTETESQTGHFARMNESDLGGYRLTKLKVAGGDETTRFEATLVKDGRVVGTVSNDGNGGCNAYRFPYAIQQELLAHATQWEQATGYEYPMGTPDGFIDHLLVGAELSRLRAIAYVVDGDDPFSTDGQGVYRLAQTGITRADFLKAVERGQLSPTVKVWDKDTYRFEAVVAVAA